jgi:hypothetical protein
MSTEDKTQVEVPASTEEKFLGITTEIDTDSVSDESDGTPPSDVTPPVEVVSGEEKPAPKRAPPDSDDPGDDEELTDYSKRVQKRIKKMSWQTGEERRRADAAEAVRDEAVRVAQLLQQRNLQNETIIRTGEGQLVERIKAAASSAVNVAKIEYREAYEKGDTEAIVEAQDKLIQAQYELGEAGRYAEDYKRRTAAPQAQPGWQQPQPQVQTPQTPQTPQVRKTPEADDWQSRNKWFNDPKHYDMTALAYGVHEDLIRNRGLRADSPEYYEELDKAMHNRFPDYFDEGKSGGSQASPSENAPPTVVAPASRNNGARPRQVKLTTTQVEVAKQLGLTPTEYATQLLKEEGIL